MCKSSLVGVPFHVDDSKNIYCSEDFKRCIFKMLISFYYDLIIRKHASKCSVCLKPIMPKPGETAASRLRALGRDFHPECFRCEDCDKSLDSKISGSECYPLANKPYCKDCCNQRMI